MKRFALAGNPNCGKTTLFNGLTGATAHVGNWPGVTVDKREGKVKFNGETINIVDLPGIYSLSPYTPEEVIARNYVLEEKPDCVINVVDATNLERNLYLTTQIMEIDVPTVIALNMMDEVEKAGNKIDEKLLSVRIGLPVVKISALKNAGLDELIKTAYESCLRKREGQSVLKNSAIACLIDDLKATLEEKGVSNPLFHAVKLAETDEIETSAHRDVAGVVEEFKKTFDDDVFGSDLEALVADARYRYISDNISSAVQTQADIKIVRKRGREKASGEEFLSKSDKIDRVLTHKVWGIPIFLVILFAIFHLTFSEDFLYLGAIFSLPSLEELGFLADGEPINYGVRWLACVYDGAVYSPGVIINNIWNDMLVGELFGLIRGLIENCSAPDWLIGLLGDGIIEGVGAVLSFLPPILVLFLFFSILEDSGYMARIAFILDRLFRKFGLSGRAFMPMIMGFGCSVPAMINARTLADDKERTATIRVIPFFSCGAKLPVLTAVSGAIATSFGLGNADLITYGMYILGVTVAIASVLLMRSTTLKGETPPFIMELPAYRSPQLKNLTLHLWDKAKHFIKKAFTIILISTIAIWLLTHFSFGWKFLSEERINESVLAGISALVQPLFTPLGFGSQLGEYGWVFVVAVIAGLIAKENVIATFSTLAACLTFAANMDFGGLDILAEEGIDAVQAMIAATGIGVPALISFIAFNMLTIPCFAAVGTAKAELNDKKKFSRTVLFWLGSSYTVSAMIYTIGSYWYTAFIWLAVIAAVIVLIVLKNKGKLNIKPISIKSKKKSACSSCCGCRYADDCGKKK